MHRILAGYARFRTGVFPGLRSQFETLANGQSPEALLITCSDSRVMPEMILQAEPGQIFPIRLAGNLVPPPGNDPSGISATVEYAVRVLKVSEIIVCGHTGCGAMKELLERAHRNDLPDVTNWLNHAGPNANWMRKTFADVEQLSPARQLHLLTEANVLAQLEHLRQHTVVREALLEGDLKLHGWMFDIARGELSAYSEATGVFAPIAVNDAAERMAA